VVPCLEVEADGVGDAGAADSGGFNFDKILCAPVRNAPTAICL
jgi:hypothetical protein